MLTFNLKKQWFDKIKSGEKTHEYREVKPYWTKRLFPKVYKKRETGLKEYLYCRTILQSRNDFDVCFKMGYPRSNETDKILYGRIKDINIINGKNTDLAVDKDVYDIEFEVVGE